MKLSRAPKLAAFVLLVGVFSTACLATPLESGGGSPPPPGSSSGSRLPDLLQSFQQGSSGLQLVDQESEVLSEQDEGEAAEGAGEAGGEQAATATPTLIQGKSDPEPTPTPEEAVAGDRTQGNEPPGLPEPSATTDPDATATPSATPDGTTTETPAPAATSTPTPVPPAESDTPTPVGTAVPTATPNGGLPPSEDDPTPTAGPAGPTPASPPTEA